MMSMVEIPGEGGVDATLLKPKIELKQEPIAVDEHAELDAVLTFLSGTLEDEDQNFMAFEPRSPQWISGDDIDESDSSTSTSSPPHSPPQECPSSPETPEDAMIYSFDEADSLFNMGVMVPKPDLTTATQRRQHRAAKLKEARKRASNRAKLFVQTNPCKSDSYAAESAAVVKVESIGTAQDSTSDKPTAALSKKEKRRLDNRRSAELSRKRKRDRLDMLERQVKFLKAQNAALISRLSKYEHVEPQLQFEETQPQMTFRHTKLSKEQEAMFNRRHTQKQTQRSKNKLGNVNKPQTLLEQLPVQWTIWPILQILIVLAAVTIGLQTNALAAVLFSVFAHWCSVTDVFPQHAKTTVAVASISVIMLGLMQPEMPQLNCISLNVA